MCRRVVKIISSSCARFFAGSNTRARKLLPPPISPQGEGLAAAHGGPAPVGRRPALVTAQAASAIRGVISGKSITGCATRLK